MSDGVWDQDDGNGISEKRSASGYILKVEATELSNKLEVGCERKSGVGGHSNAYALKKSGRLELPQIKMRGY